MRSANRNSSDIKNKIRRSAVKAKEKLNKAKDRKDARKLRRINVEKVGEEVKKTPKTLDSLRTTDVTRVKLNDEDLMSEDCMDEFADYFEGTRTPKICITTCRKPSKVKLLINLILRECLNLLRIYSKHFLMHNILNEEVFQ